MFFLSTIWQIFREYRRELPPKVGWKGFRGLTCANGVTIMSSVCLQYVRENTRGRSMKQKYKTLTRAPIYKVLNLSNSSALNKNAKQLC